MSRGAKRAYDKADRLLKNKGLADNVRQNLGTARSIAALATIFDKSGRPQDAAEANGIAQEALGEALVQALLPDAMHGKAFRDGPLKPRSDALGRLIMDAFGDLDATASANDILRHIERNGGNVIHEIDHEKVYWRRADGRDAATSIKTVQNRISAYRKKKDFPVPD